MEKYYNGLPTIEYLHKLCDTLGVNRFAIIPSANYNDDDEPNGVIYYKSEISKRSIGTFVKFLMYNKIDVQTWDEKSLVITKIK